MPIWTTYAIGLVAIVAVMVAWVAVQGAWRRAFPDSGSDPDVLAERAECGGCGRAGCGRCGRAECTNRCGAADPAEEETA